VGAGDETRSGGPPYWLGAIASKQLVTITSTATLREASQLITLHHVSAIVIVNGRGEPVGLISQYDVSRFASQPAGKGNALDRAVTEAMTPTLLTLQADCRVIAAARIMTASHIHRVLVMSGATLVGLVSLTDIARLVGEVGFHRDPPTADDDVLLANLKSPREAFAASLARCVARHDFGERLYTRFLAMSPDIRARFAGVDMARQQAAIVAMLQIVVDVTQAKPEALAKFGEYAVLHDRDHHDVRPEHYALWLESLVATARASDPKFDLGVEQAWRMVLGHVIAYMSRRY